MGPRSLRKTYPLGSPWRSGISHRRIRFKALDGVQRIVEITALPLEGQGGYWLGSVAIFWEAHEG
jgi:hypothetical protein